MELLTIASYIKEDPSEGIAGAIWGFIIFFVIVFLLFVRPKIINQFERGIVLKMGKYQKTFGPGFHFIVPILQKVTKVDVRTHTCDIPPQEVITKDNVTVKVDAVVYMRVLDPQKAVLEIANYSAATSNFAASALRDVTGNFELDELLGKREVIAEQLKQIVDTQTDKWGIDIESVRLQNIELPSDMKRAMAKQAEAERERRAAIIAAEGEKSAAKSVAEAVQMLNQVHGGMELRTLQTLEKISTDPSQKTVVLLPTDLMNKIK